MNWREIDCKKSSGTEYTTCPKCSHTRKKKKDKCLSIDHDTKHYNCSHCGIKGFAEDKDDSNYTKKVKEEEKIYTIPVFKNKTDLPEGIVNWFLKRGINQSTINHFKVTHGRESMPINGKWEDRDTVQYNYFKDGTLVNTKFKTPSKAFKMVTGAEKIPYNLDAIKDSTECLICEGEEEAMVWYQSGYKHAVSVPNGSVVGKNNLDYIRKYWDSHFKNKTKVYIAPDNDEAGQSLKEDLIRLFGRDVSYDLIYPKLEMGEGKTTKDANDILLNKGPEFLMKLKNDAKGFPIKGIFRVSDVKDEMLRQFKDKDAFVKGTDCYKKELSKHWSWRKGEINVLFGAGNQGKTCFWTELMVLKAMNEETVFAIFSPEQSPPIDFYNDIIHTYIGKSTDPNFPHLQMSMEEYEKGLDFAEKHFVYVYPEDYHDKDTIMNIFKSLIVKHDIGAIIFDPFNQIERIGEDTKLRDDQYIKMFGKTLKRFILLHDIYTCIITHSDAKFDQNSGEMLKPNMYRDIEGGKMWSKIADNIIFYYRPHFHTNIRDPLCIVGTQKIKKQKLVGTPGEVEYTYEKTTNRYTDRSGHDDFTGKKTDTVVQQELQMTFPEESWGDAGPDEEKLDEVPF